MANLNLNKVVLGGRLTADPELRSTQSGVSVTSFSIAINRRFAKQGEAAQTDFINVVAWRQQAEFITKYFRKGSSICICGSLQSRSWTDNEGKKRYATDVVCDEVMFVDSKSENSAQNSAFTPDYAAAMQGTGAPMPAEPKFEEIADEDDLPF